MGAPNEAVLKLILCALAVGVLALRHLSQGKLGQERAGPWLALAAAIAALAYTNFGRFHGWPPLHDRELFHYYLGSRYYPELQHDGLYVASLGAQFQNHPELGVQPEMRDLRSQRVAPVPALEAHAREVRMRFDDARWRAFVADHDYFLGRVNPVQMAVFRLDHGFNPSPLWIFVARLVSSWLPATTGVFLLLASLDLLLLGAMCFAVARVFGGRVAAMVILLLGLGAPWRYDWIGGAFLRADWFAALGLGLCALKRERMLLAGGLIGYAAMIRVFPAAFLVGPAVVGLRQWTQGSPPRWLLRFAAGALAAAGIGLAAGSLSGGGFAAWPAFFQNLTVYREELPENGIGLENALLVDRTARLETTGDSNLQYDLAWEAAAEQAARERRAWILAGSLLLGALTLLAMWRQPLLEAALSGCGLLFAALAMASYYWIVLALVPLAGGGWLPTAGVLAVSAVVFAMILATGESLAITYGVASWAVLVFLTLWLASAVRRR